MSEIQDVVPGTANIEDIRQDATTIILQPVPTDDPNDPLNWSKSRKALNFALASFYSLMTFVLLDIGPIIWGNLNEELGISYQDLNNSWAANTAGLALGCVFLYPIANKYGRRPVYIVSLIVQLAGTIWFAKMQTNWENIAINVLVGLAGAISEAVVQMTVADLFFVHQRASANAVYFATVTTGSFLAPVAAGYSAASQGWRWIWWWTAIFLGINLVAVVFLFEETKYVPVLGGRQDVASDESTTAKPITGSTDKKPIISATGTNSESTPSSAYARKSYRQRLAWTTRTDVSLLSHTYQPFIILVTFPAVTYTALMYGAYLAWFSVCGTTVVTYLLFPPYNFGPSEVGLFSLAPFAGSVVGFFYGGPLADWWILQAAKRNGGVFEPEMRLHLALFCILTTPAGILCYGLGLANGLEWIVLAVGYGIFGFAFTVVCDLSLTYVLDCYQDIVGDALVAVAFVRNGVATIIVFALTPWIERQGLYDFFVTVGCLATFMAVLTVPMILFGKRCRRMTTAKYRKYALLQPLSRAFDG